MKFLIFTFFTFFILGCKPEQTATEFSVSINPEAQETVEATTNEDTPILINYSIKDSADSIGLTFDLFEKPKFGTLKDCKFLTKKQWQCTYLPISNFNGEDELSFKTKDGDFVSKDKSLLKIKVMPVPDSPVAGPNQEFTLMENSKIVFKINDAKDPDTIESKLKYSVVEPPKNGQLSDCFSPGKLTDCKYTPTAEFYGQDSIVYKVVDPESEELSNPSTAVVKFNVLREWVPVNGISSVTVEDKASNALIVFALDTSGSMQPYIEHMKQSVMNFVDDIANRGFKATIAFINSDQNTSTYEDKYKFEKPHPSFPSIANSWKKTWKRVPRSSAVKIFEINAYDAAWNEETKTKLSQTKSEILQFISNLKEGSDDERLLCSTVRFLNSDYANNKKFVGVFSLANEDDALMAANLKKAYSDCHNETIQENIPLASCQEIISCENGSEGCSPEWIYEYTKVDLNPYPSKFKGACERSVPNMVLESQSWRKGEVHTPKTKTVYETVCDPNLIELETWRKGVKQTAITKKVAIIECRDDWKTFETWRRGIETLPKMVIQKYTECKLEWETLDNPEGCRNLERTVQDGFLNPTSKYEKGSCEQLSSSVKAYWTDCVNETKETFNGCKTVGYKDEPTGEIRTVNIDERGICSDLTSSELSEWGGNCDEYSKTVDDGCRQISKQEPDGYRIDYKDELGTCENLSVGWATCSNYIREIQVQRGTKKEQYACEKEGGETCEDHSSSLINGTCEKIRDAGYNAPTLTPKQIKKSNVEKSCLEVTGYEVCDSINWNGTKSITKTEGCALKTSGKTYSKYDLKEGQKESLANALVNKLQDGFIKSVYVSVAHDLTLNTEALEKAETEKLALPSAKRDRLTKKAKHLINEM